MSALDQIVQINISQQTAAIPQPSFSIPAIFGPSNRFSTHSTTGNILSGSNQLTNLASLTGVVQGASVTGPGIPDFTYVLSVTGNVATLSANATAPGTGITVVFEDSIRAYTSTAAMVADGFLTSDPEYIQAAELLQQPLVPSLFYVGRYSASVAQVDNIIVNSAVNGHTYSGLINGLPWSYTATGVDTTTTIATAIASSINALVGSGVTATSLTNDCTVTSTVHGVPFTDVQTAPDANYTITPTTPNHTITTDIAQAQVQNNTWYGLVICSHTDGDILQTAAYIETQLKIFVAASSTAAIATSATTDIASVMGGKKYKRTSLLFTTLPAEGKEGAWVGGQLPQVPGSNNWAFKTLFGCSPDSLTANQQAILIGDPVIQLPGKNVNIYQTVGGVPITEMGTMIGGQYMDITVGIDWLQATLQVNIYTALVQAVKIPYTDKGVGILISAVKAAIDQGVVNGLIDGASPITITAPSVLSVPASQRANRVAPTISFSCRLAGAINAVIVQGTVTV
jgi:hypothetical protein